MIYMEKYNEDFENFYCDEVFKVVNKTFRQEIVNSCRKYFPSDFFKMSNIDKNFKKLILAKYKDLNNIYEYIQNVSTCIMKSECFTCEAILGDCYYKSQILNILYKDYHDTYEKVRDRSCVYNSVNQKMNVKLVLESKMLTCPYCNRDYINSRGDKVSGAQLDHFFSRKKHPIFTLCLYNLIPICANCNRIKSASSQTLVSPFDEEFDFDNKVKFSYLMKGQDAVEVVIRSQDNITNNIELLKLKEAYEIHSTDIQEIIHKSEVYNASQIEEIIESLESRAIAITKSEIKEMIFGKVLDSKEFGKRPLSKMRYDVLKEIGVY